MEDVQLQTSFYINALEEKVRELTQENIVKTALINQQQKQISELTNKGEQE